MNIIIPLSESLIIKLNTVDEFPIRKTLKLYASTLYIF